MTASAAPEPRIWIKDLRPGDDVDEAYAIRSRELRQRRSGGPYLALVLADRSGEVVALAWENVERIGDVCRPGQVVRIGGQVQRYNQRLQVVVRRAAVAEDVDPGGDLFVRSSRMPVDALWRALEEQIEGIRDQHLKQLLFRVFAEPDVRERFRVAPAARSLHHAYRSGLLEHTVSMCRAGRALARHYELDEDLVLAGCLLHDLGKIWELESGASIEYTDDGRLLGHIPMTATYLDRRIAELPEFPDETRRQLLHVVLSHHGEYEYGAPRRPKFPEALLVHVVDNLDSKLAGMLEAIQGDCAPDAAWTPYSRILDRYIYRRRRDGTTS